MPGKELVMEGPRSAVGEIELRISEKRISRMGVVQTGAQVERKGPHFSGAPKKWTSAHRRQLFESSFFAAFILEPDLQSENCGKMRFRKNGVVIAYMYIIYGFVIFEYRFAFKIGLLRESFM